MKVLKVGLTSGSAIKKSAIEVVLNELLGKGAYELVTISSESEVNEQPVGYEAVVGAETRIANFLEQDDTCDIVFSIENGIYEKEHKCWYDFAVLSWFDVGQAESRIVTLKTCGKYDIQFPFEQVQKARKKGFDTTTVGSILAEDGVVTNSKDPHSSLSDFSREEILISLLQRAVRSGFAPSISDYQEGGDLFQNTTQAILEGAKLRWFLSGGRLRVFRLENNGSTRYGEGLHIYDALRICEEDVCAGGREYAEVYGDQEIHYATGGDPFSAFDWEWGGFNITAKNGVLSLYMNLPELTVSGTTVTELLHKGYDALKEFKAAQ